MTLPPWEQRPVEVANLLNPVFCGLLIRDAASGYRVQTTRAFPYALAFLVLPITLYPPARAALPRTTAAILSGWIQEHPVLQVQVADRVLRLKEYTREAILFGLQHGLLRVADDGGLQPGLAQARNPFAPNTEPAECSRAANLVGRWLGKTGEPSFVLTLWGLQP